ncbi:hypothetical protein F5Y09DRAFT_324740 [Xylaria sp. FL1042]|nr:hypothetical protein F5Y09DRAFT_324740 [Xylaria sp. FL1042]
MATTIFRMFSPDKPKSKEDRAKKRKAQLRKAQLTYRERKERYTKALEEHVAEAKVTEADLYREIDELRKTVQKLAGFIQDQGMQIPDELNLPIQIDNVAGESPPDEFLLSQQDHQHMHGINNHIHSTLREKGQAAVMLSDPNNVLRLGDLDPLAVGMEFVLALERACITHVYPDPDTAHEVSGHALTVTGQLAPAYQMSVFESPRAHETFCRDLPEQSLHSLLTLSSELCHNESEITPIEAWHHIRSQPHFGGMEARNLNRLVGQLQEAAKCHGFGAAISRESFEKLMFETMLVGCAL